MTDSAHLTFVIPIRHPLNARDWSVEMANLARTVQSIAAQQVPGWRAVVVANAEAELPDLPEGFQVVRVDFPPNVQHEGIRDWARKDEVLRAVRRDKGRRVVAGLAAAGPSDYIMVVDGDDLVSARLSGFVKAHGGGNGWRFDRGWALDASQSIAYLMEKPFHKVCGSSLIIRRDLMTPPDPEAPDYWDWVETVAGDHSFTDERFAKAGHPLEPLSFAGACYLVGHANSHSQSERVVAYALRRRYLRQRPLALLRSLSRFRLIRRGFRREFFGGAG